MIFKVKNNKVNFLFFLMALIIAASAGGGADYVDYLRWADYFKNNNIEELKIYQKSENGLPLVSWYYGSGLIAGFINKILFVDGLLSMKINSIILALLNIFLLNKILIKYNILKLSNFFVICIFILILPAGYYINKYSTETWTIFLTLLSIFFYEEGINKNKKINLLLIGISAYFLILVKITNIFLAISLLSLFFFKELSKNNKNLLKKIISFCSVSFFVILGIILVLIYHKLLLGSYFTSFYSFGDDTFQTFSIHNFKIFEVLFSTWHGLLLYHPVYLFINLVLLFFFLKKNINIYFKFLILINIFLFASQLLIQASHFFWFMGTGTYGARGFAGISVITFYLILNFKDEFRQIKISFFSNHRCYTFWDLIHFFHRFSCLNLYIKPNFVFIFF